MNEQQSNFGPTYILVVRIKINGNVVIGRLGRCHFPAGYYCYVGSAKGHFMARVARHHRSAKKRHWHIDHLLLTDYAQIQEIWHGKLTECQTAAIFFQPFFHPLVGFGSSDCRCRSHLFHTQDDHAGAERCAANGFEMLRESFFG